MNILNGIRKDLIIISTDLKFVKPEIAMWLIVITKQKANMRSKM